VGLRSKFVKTAVLWVRPITIKFSDTNPSPWGPRIRNPVKTLNRCTHVAI
jgi:hypothetical protein